MAKISEDNKIGCHVSNSGEAMLSGSVDEAIAYHANAFMVYLGPPQSTIRKDVSLLHADEMKEKINANGIKLENVIIHAPYIVNLAQGNQEKRNFAINFISNEMKTMAAVGAKYIVLHPGAHMQQGIDVGLENIADSLKQILENTAYDDTYIALETMSGKGSECCSRFEEIAKLLELNNYNNRLVVCFDTCHVFDAGYDITKKYEEVIKEFDEKVGIDRIKVIHLNDSKNILGSKKDRHENIGYGKIGFNTLMKFVTDERFKDIPKILETPFVKDDKGDYPPYLFEIQMIRNNKFNKQLITDIIENYRKKDLH